jgi:hypothetical protein
MQRSAEIESEPRVPSDPSRSQWLELPGTGWSDSVDGYLTESLLSVVR